MTNAEHIRALTDEELASVMAFHCRYSCGNCPAVRLKLEHLRGDNGLCPAFIAAIKKQEACTGNTQTTKTIGYIDWDTCNARLLEWLKTEGEPSVYQFYEHMEGMHK